MKEYSYENYYPKDKNDIRNISKEKDRMIVLHNILKDCIIAKVKNDYGDDEKYFINLKDYPEKKDDIKNKNIYLYKISNDNLKTCSNYFDSINQKVLVPFLENSNSIIDKKDCKIDHICYNSTNESEGKNNDIIKYKERRNKNRTKIVFILINYAFGKYSLKI